MTLKIVFIYQTFHNRCCQKNSCILSYQQFILLDRDIKHVRKFSVQML